MYDIHHRPRKRDASETGVRRCIGFVLSKNLSPVPAEEDDDDDVVIRRASCFGAPLAAATELPSVIRSPDALGAR